MRSIFGQEQIKIAANNINNMSNLRVLIERRTHSYHKLPQQLLKLSILKLDGSLFDVLVGKNATVAELKQAVEEVFTSSPKEGQGKISWSHVWGHFCLCYEGQKLINDKASIRNFGIKDGDQLKFIRHMSINYSPSKTQSKYQSTACKPYSTSMLSSGSDVHEEKEQRTTLDHNDKNENQGYNSKYYSFEDQEESHMSEFKLAHFLKGWLSYSRLWGSSRKGMEGKSRPSRFGLQCLGDGPRMIQLQG